MNYSESLVSHTTIAEIFNLEPISIKTDIKKIGTNAVRRIFSDWSESPERELLRLLRRRYCVQISKDDSQVAVSIHHLDDLVRTYSKADPSKEEGLIPAFVELSKEKETADYVPVKKNVVIKDTCFLFCFKKAMEEIRLAIEDPISKTSQAATSPTIKTPMDEYILRGHVIVIHHQFQIIENPRLHLMYLKIKFKQDVEYGTPAQFQKVTISLPYIPSVDSPLIRKKAGDTIRKVQSYP